jgi:EAL domain-containing protein (putative c-di-GMP-specific phosphodiesterase class I)
VAEYVEHEAIANAVRRLGVDYAQCYAFGKPKPLDEVMMSLGRDDRLTYSRPWLPHRVGK